MKRVIVLLVGMSLFTGALADELDRQKKKLIDELILLIDTNDTAEYFKKKYTEKYTAMLKERAPDIDDKALNLIPVITADLIDSEIAQKNSLNEDLYLVFHREFNKKELKQLVKFYRSATGQKALEKLPDVIYQSGIVARNWGNALEVPLRNRISERFKQENIAIAAPQP